MKLAIENIPTVPVGDKVIEVRDGAISMVGVPEEVRNILLKERHKKRIDCIERLYELMGGRKKRA